MKESGSVKMPLRDYFGYDKCIIASMSPCLAMPPRLAEETNEWTNHAIAWYKHAI